MPAPTPAAAPTAGKAAPSPAAPTINVQWYVRDNLRPYDGDASFLRGPTQRTLELWDRVQVMLCGWGLLC